MIKIRKILGWCVVINFAIMLLFLLILLMDHQWMYEIHYRFLQVPKDDYEALLFNHLAIWKLLVVVFFLIPYIALRIVSKKN